MFLVGEWISLNFSKSNIEFIYINTMNTVLIVCTVITEFVRVLQNGYLIISWANLYFF